MRYIISMSNQNNPHIQEMQEDGSYTSIALSSKSDFDAITELCYIANRSSEPFHKQAKINKLINEYEGALRTAKLMINSTYGSDPRRHAYWRGVRVTTDIAIKNLKSL